MAQNPAKSNMDFRGDQPRDFSFKDFRGMNTQSSRIAIGDDEFAWLENVMPIGNGNLRVLPAPGAEVADVDVTPYRAWCANINETDYVYIAGTNGSITQVLLKAPHTVSAIAAASTLSASGAWMDQWKNERVLFVDPSKGYFSWDGSVFVKNGGVVQVDVTNGGTGYNAAPTVGFSSGGGSGAAGTAVMSGTSVASVTITNPGTGYTSSPAVAFTPVSGGSGAAATARVLLGPTAGGQIAVYGGRVWTANKRVVTFSAPSSYYDFTVANLGGQFVMTDATLHDVIHSLAVGNNYLYIIGSHSVDVVSDVRVDTTNNVTVFSRVNVETSVGTVIPESVFFYGRGMYWVTSSGVYSLQGSTPQKISDALDRIFTRIDFTKPITAGEVTLYNIACLSFCFTYNDPLAGARKLIAIQFQNKWFLADQGDVDIVFVQNDETVDVLWGLVGSSLIKLFSNTSTALAHTWKSKLWDLGNPVNTKQVLKFAQYMELDAGVATDLTVTLDSERNEENLDLTAASYINWVNSGGQQIVFVGAAAIDWTSSGLAFVQADASQFGKFIGLTVASESVGAIYVMSIFEFMHRTRW